MEIEIVRTINGRKATRAKAWRICETGVTYDPPYLARRTARKKASACIRLCPDERAVLDALRACGRASMMRIRESMPARPSLQHITHILTRLTALGLVIEQGTTNGSILYEAAS